MKNFICYPQVWPKKMLTKKQISGKVYIEEMSAELNYFRVWIE